MRYLCLIYHDEQRLDALPPDEYDALAGDTLAYHDELRRGGHLLAAHALECGQSATTVRVRGGRVAVADGPCAETREQLGAIVLIEARDLNEAIRLASQLPSARVGSVEIRPVRDHAAQ